MDISNPQPYGNPVHDFQGVMLKVIIGNLLAFLLTIYLLVKLGKYSYRLVAVCSIITPVFWMLSSNLAYIDCAEGDLCSQKITQNENTTITLLVFITLTLTAFILARTSFAKVKSGS